jgi:hypothetical protein
LETHAEVSFPHGKKQQVFKFCAHAQSHSPPASLPDLKNRITAAVETITPDMLLSVAGIGLSPRCVPCDQGCTHRKSVGMYHKLVELLLVFIILFIAHVNVINFQTAPIILIHPVHNFDNPHYAKRWIFPK